MLRIPNTGDSDDQFRPVLPTHIIKSLIGVEQRYLASIVEQSKEVILSHTLEGSILSWNRRAEEIFGYAADEMLGRSIRTLFPADRSGDVSALLACTGDGRSAGRLETVWQCKNGRRVNIALTFSPIRDENEAIIGVSTVARDITQEKRLENELSHERALIESAFNALQDIFFVIDLDGGLVRWNDYLSTISGYDDAELAGMSALVLFTPDCRSAVEHAIAQALTNGSARLEADGLTKDGRVIPFELIGSMLTDTDGKPFTICGIARNISERRQSEEMLRLTQFAIDHCSDAAYWMEPDGRIFYVNQEACRILGYRRDELLSMSIYDIDPNFHSDTWSDHWQLIKQDQSVRLESVHRTKNGRNIPVDISSNYVRFGEREVNCALARDLTNKKHAEQKTREYEIRMHMSQRMEALGTLAGGIAHDFNNILASIIGFSELALDKITPGTDLNGYVREIFTAGLRARDLVRRILTFSRHAEHEKQPVHLKMVVKEALKLLRASIPATIAIESDLQSDRLIMADPSQMHQIIMNLCTNASQALQPEGGILQVGLKAVNLTEDYTATHPDINPGTYLELTVADTGKGIEAGILDRIFNPFFTTKKQGEGTGLGLSVVHGIVKEHGGHILVRSRVGQGTTFIVLLPMLERTRQRLDDPDEPLPTGKEHILLVDDEPAIVKMAAMMLTRLKYKVTPLTSSIEALAYFRDDPNQFDLVITDLTMPNLPGLKLAGELTKIRPDLPVILCTGHSEGVLEAISPEMGIKAMLSKPLEKKKLAPVVRKVLDEAGKRLARNTSRCSGHEHPL